MAAHLRTFSKECGLFAHTIFPGKRIHLRTQFPQVNVTFAHIRFSQVNGMFAHIRFSQVNGMFALARLYRQAMPLFPDQAIIFLSHFIRQMTFKAQPVMNM